MEDLNSEQLVRDFYKPLYRFALSLSRKEADAGDLVQQTFYAWAAKGHQLRDANKAKSWLFTTLYRAFLTQRRHNNRFVETLDGADFIEPPHVAPSVVNALDAATLQEALYALEERYRAPLTLFYMQQHSYREIADILGIPVGTVMSRISRGKVELRKTMLGQATKKPARKMVPAPRGEINE